MVLGERPLELQNYGAPMQLHMTLSCCSHKQAIIGMIPGTLGHFMTQEMVFNQSFLDKLLTKPRLQSIVPIITSEMEFRCQVEWLEETTDHKEMMAKDPKDQMKWVMEANDQMEADKTKWVLEIVWKITIIIWEQLSRRK